MLTNILLVNYIKEKIGVAYLSTTVIYERNKNGGEDTTALVIVYT